MNNYPSIIEKTHDDFNKASDRTLENAKAILDGFEKAEFEKGKRLTNLGFNEVKPRIC